MGVEHVISVPHNETDPTTPFTFTIPAEAVAGTWLQIGGANRNGTAELTVTDDSGEAAWGLIRNQPADTTRSGQAFGKFAGPGDAGATVTVANATNSSSGTLSVYSGVDPTTPYGGVTGESNAAGDTTQAGITVPAGAMVSLYVVHVLNNQTATDAVATDPSALTARQHAESSGGSDCAVDHFSAVRATAGPTGDISYTAPSNPKATILFYLNPAAAPAAGGSLFVRRDHPALLTNLRR